MELGDAYWGWYMGIVVIYCNYIYLNVTVASVSLSIRYYSGNTVTMVTQEKY